MKNLNKTLAAVLIAASMSMTSCVDNEVSPEVKELRQSQVALVSARADLAAAQANQQKIANDYATANNALLLASSEATLQVNLAKADKDVKLAQAALKDAELQFATSVKNLEVYIAGLGNTKAQEYLDEYSDAAGMLSAKVGDQLVKSAELTKAQLYLESVNAPWILTKASLERDMIDLTAKLSAEEAGLVLLEAVKVDPSTSVTEINELTAQISDLQNKNRKISLDLEKADEAVDLASNKLNAAYDAMDDYNDWADDVVSYNSSIISATQNKVSAQQNLDAINIDLAAANVSLTGAKAALTPMQTAYNTALATKNTKKADMDKAQTELQVAQNNDAANGTTTATAKQTAYDAAVTAYNDAVTAFNTAQSDRNTAQNLVNTKQNAVNNLTYDFNSATEDFNDASSSIAFYMGLKAGVEANMAAIKPAYDDAVANISTYENDYRIKQAAFTPLYIQQSTNNSLINEYNDIVWDLNNYIDNINWVISNKMSSIEGLKGQIHGLEQSISSTSIDKADQEKVVAGLVVELAKLEAEIAAQTSIVAKWKALLDAALAAS